MELILIPGSPYARKVRIVATELGLSFDLRMLERYPPTVDEVGEHNPALRVPILRDGDMELFESDLIVEYLLQTYGYKPIAPHDPPFLPAIYREEAQWTDRKRAAIIQTATDTLVNHAYLNWCGLDETRRNLMGFDLAARWEQRIARCLDWLDFEAKPDGFVPGYMTLQDIALVCMLEWTDARMRFPWREGRPNLIALVETFRDRASFADSRFPPMPDFLAPALEDH